MKEPNQHLKSGDKLGIKAEVKKEQQTILTGKIKPKRGQIIYEIRKDTGLIRPAHYRSSTIDFSQAMVNDFSVTKELLVHEDCIYIPATNCSNALRKFKKNSDQSFYYAKEPPLTFET